MNVMENADILRYMNAVSAYNKGFREQRGVYIETLGCQQNEADSERLYGYAEKMGYVRVSEPSMAALILVNTCAIREHAEKRALSLIGQMKHKKEADRTTLIGVVGCMSAEEHRVDELRCRYPYVDFTLAPSELFRLPEALFRRIHREKRQFYPAVERPPVVEGIPVSRRYAHRAYVSIMYGCNNFCSYCIVPYVRGRERSRSAAAIEAEVRDCIKNGARDITLLGQNVNSYAADCDFATLLRRLDAIEGDYVLRFMTSHPKDVSDALIDAVATGTHVEPHFHLPMQSGSDKILRLMNRHYDRAQYLSIVAKLRAAKPDIVLTTDVIVGFPGEDDADFEETMSLIEEVRFDMIYSFLYSPRKGTPAASMDPVPEDVKAERFARLLAAQDEYAKEAQARYLGQRLRVLVDGKSKENDNMYSGRTDAGKLVHFEATDAELYRFVTVEIDRCPPYSLYGHIVSNGEHAPTAEHTPTVPKKK